MWLNAKIKSNGDSKINSQDQQPLNGSDGSTAGSVDDGGTPRAGL
jgi:hypothetical protein